jgi:hypothetical protein
MSDDIKTIQVHMKGPSRAKPGGVSVTGHYRVEDGFVIMCKPGGVPIELNGKRFRRKVGTKSGELSDREAARMMTLEIRNELKRHAGVKNSDFNRKLIYPRTYY